MVIQFDKITQFLEAQDLDISQLKTPQIAGNKDTQNKLNKILRPQGIVVQDTWNNFIFPIRPTPMIDTSKFETFEVIKRFRASYTLFPSLFLPWHFVVEMIGDRYYILQMRPIDTKFPMTNEEVLNSKHYFESDVVRDFFEKPVYQIENMIHICLIGDSKTDVYPDKLYKQIGRTCIAPLFRDMRITGSYESRIFNFNLGEKFRFSNLIRFARR